MNTAPQHHNTPRPTLARRTARLLLAGVVGCVLLGSCYDYDRTLEVGGPQVVDSHPVKTQFSVSLSGEAAPTTRMADDACLGTNDGKFTGMKNIRLFPFALDDAALGEPQPLAAPIGAGQTAVGSGVNLPSSGASPATLADNSIAPRTDGNVAQFYANVEIPIGTNAFLFYGEASTPAGADSRDYGKTVASYPEGAPATGSISFGLQPIYQQPAGGESEIPAKAQALADYLTNILNGNDGEGLDEDSKKRLKTNTAGSSANVLQLVQNLYRKMAGTSVGTRILTMATHDELGNLTFHESLLNYPGEIGLPDGAAYMAYDEAAAKFVPIVGNGTVDGSQPGKPTYIASLGSYAYPAGLCYYGNSRVVVSTEERVSAKYTGGTPWSTYLSNAATYAYNPAAGPQAVEGSTRSVALVNQIGFGVAQLELTVQATADHLKDRLADDEQKNIYFDNYSETPFPVTGILVGSQTASGYNFKPSPLATSVWTVYDGSMPADMALSRTLSTASRTLLMPTVENIGGTDETIVVAVEFRNQAEDFHGVGGQLIPKGCKFYLMGELKMAEGVQPAGGEQLTQVFAAGHTTKVRFMVSSLENAYNAVPDLRLAQLEIGLTVDLNWQKGIHHTTTLE